MVCMRAAPLHNNPSGGLRQTAGADSYKQLLPPRVDTRLHGSARSPPNVRVHLHKVKGEQDLDRFPTDL